MISVLIPSKGKPGGLKSSIESLKNKIRDREIEFLVFVDDEEEFPAEYRDTCKNLGAKLILGPRGKGYNDLHVKINTLAHESKGEWLMLWNDDCLMHTDNWTQGIKEEYDPINKLVVLSCDVERRANEFPLISRKMYEVMGHYSLHYQNDSWVQNLSAELGIQYFLNLDVQHIRPDRDYNAGNRDFYSPENVELLKLDRDKLQAFLNTNS